MSFQKTYFVLKKENANTFKVFVDWSL